MLVSDRETFDKAKSILLDAPHIYCDTETFPIVPGEPTYLMGIAFRCPIQGRGMDISFYMPFRHQHNPTLFEGDVNLPLEWVEELELVFSNSHTEWVFHNAKFDLEVLYRDDLIIRGKVWDTMIMSHMSDENGPHGLDFLAKKFSVEGKKDGKISLTEISKELAKASGIDKPKKMSGWHLIPPQVMGPYAEKDLELTERVFKVLLKDLQRQYLDNFETLYDREEQFLHFLREMERNGVLINKPKAIELLDECVERRVEIQEELGFDPGKLDVLAHNLFAPPPKGLGLTPGPLGQPTKSYPLGRPSTAKAVLERNPHPVTDKVLEFRGYVKAEGTWFRGFLDKTWSDGRVRATYKQHGTVTTRLSCADPNMQQLPREGDPEDDDIKIKERVKEILDVAPGWQLWEFDYSQMEFRLSGCYSKEQAIIDAYAANSDMHQSTADALGITRYEAKTVNFLIIYGGGALKLAAQLGREVEEAQEFLDNFWTAYPKLNDTVYRATQAAEQRGWVSLWTGRRRHFQYPSECYKAFNSIVQGGGAEIVKESSLRLMELRKDTGANFRVVAQVHDSLWFEVPDGEESILDKIQDTMQWPNGNFIIDFPVDRKRLA